MGSTARIVIVFGAAVLAGCAMSPEVRELYSRDPRYISEAALQGGYVNTPFMRYMDQRDAERRVAQEIANEFERRAAQ